MLRGQQEENGVFPSFLMLQSHAALLRSELMLSV